jgi:hypothetical protein
VTRRISLPIEGATETECGGCRQRCLSTCDLFGPLLHDHAKIERHPSCLEAEREHAAMERDAADFHTASAALERVLDEQVAIESYLVAAGIESPDSVTPAGTDAPMRILEMVEDLHRLQSEEIVRQKNRAERAEEFAEQRSAEARKAEARVDWLLAHGHADEKMARDARAWRAVRDAVGDDAAFLLALPDPHGPDGITEEEGDRLEAAGERVFDAVRAALRAEDEVPRG